MITFPNDDKNIFYDLCHSYEQGKVTTSINETSLSNNNKLHIITYSDRYAENGNLENSAYDNHRNNNNNTSYLFSSKKHQNEEDLHISPSLEDNEGSFNEMDRVFDDYALFYDALHEQSKYDEENLRIKMNYESDVNPFTELKNYSLHETNNCCCTCYTNDNIGNSNYNNANASESYAIYTDKQYYNEINAKEVFEANKAISSTVSDLIQEPPSLPEVENKIMKKRKHENTNLPTLEPKMKKNRSCQCIESKYPNGLILSNDIVVTKEDIEKFNTLKNTLIECSCCRKVVSILEILIVDGSCFYCKKCLKDNLVDLTRLKTDIFENDDICKMLNYDGEVLYQCDRLKHARPLSHFLRYVKKDNFYRIVKHCPFCRNYKIQESYFK